MDLMRCSTSSQLNVDFSVMLEGNRFLVFESLVISLLTTFFNSVSQSFWSDLRILSAVECMPHSGNCKCDLQLSSWISEGVAFCLGLVASFPSSLSLTHTHTHTHTYTHTNKQTNSHTHACTYTRSLCARSSPILTDTHGSIGRGDWTYTYAQNSNVLGDHLASGRQPL